MILLQELLSISLVLWTLESTGLILFYEQDNITAQKVHKERLTDTSILFPFLYFIFTRNGILQAIRVSGGLSGVVY